MCSPIGRNHDSFRETVHDEPRFFESSANPNKYDWLFEGWADYWEWRADREGIPITMRVDPNLIKALAFAESRLGLNTGSGSLLNLGRNAINRLKGDIDIAGENGFSDLDWRKKYWQKTAIINGMGWYQGNYLHLTDDFLHCCDPERCTIW